MVNQPKGKHTMSLFASAKTIEKTAPKSRKPAAKKVEMTNLEKLAAIDAAMKALKGLKETYETSVKGAMSEHFVTQGCAIKSRPENFEGVDGDATGSCQLKLRSSASVLTADDVALLKDHSVPFEVIETTAEAFFINPTYTNDMELLGKVEVALSKVDLPGDFLMKQERETKSVASDESLDAVFTKSPALAAELLPVVSVLAIRPKIADDKFWSILDGIMNPVAEAEAA